MTMRNEEHTRRLDPVYRAVSDQRRITAAAMEALGRYSEEVNSGGRFDESTRERIWKACEALAQELTLWLAVYRDVSLIDVDASRVAVDRGAGVAVLGDKWGNTSLGDELRLFLHFEGERCAEKERRLT